MDSTVYCKLLSLMTSLIPSKKCFNLQNKMLKSAGLSCVGKQVVFMFKYPRNLMFMIVISNSVIY